VAGSPHLKMAQFGALLQLLTVKRRRSVDLHCGQIQGFFHHAPVDNLHAFVEHVPYIVKEVVPSYGDNPIAVVSPDAGGVARAKVCPHRTAAPFLPSHTLQPSAKRPNGAPRCSWRPCLA